jgi:hypothetical protein
VLAGYGVTEGAMRCPIFASMEVVQLPRAAVPECPSFMDRHAWHSDGVILINRVKPHTDFHARYESGLVKMSVIGLGKDDQALAIHRHGVRGLAEVVPRVAERLLRLGKILLGIAVVENAYDETMLIEGIPADRILEREPELLQIAAAHMPRLPVRRLDLLVVDRMGKDISGVGIDPNIIGRTYIRGEKEPLSPEISTIVVDDLTEASHGNAAGMGLADLITRRFFEKIDFDATNINVATSGFLLRAKVPMVAQNAAQAVEWALHSCGPMEPGTERVIRIQDTLHLSEIDVSPAVLAEIEARAEIEVIGAPTALLEPHGALRAF